MSIDNLENYKSKEKLLVQLLNVASDHVDRLYGEIRMFNLALLCVREAGFTRLDDKNLSIDFQDYALETITAHSAAVRNVLVSFNRASKGDQKAVLELTALLGETEIPELDELRRIAEMSAA